jgi:HSP20 family protein
MRNLPDFFDPFREFSNFLGRANRESHIPSCDVIEKDGKYLLSLDLPGMKKEDIKLELKDGVLTLSGERREDHEEKKGGYRRIERFRGSFERTFWLPEGVKPEQVEANYADGVLRISVPKAGGALADKSQQIKIGTQPLEKRAPEKVA